MVLDEMFVIVVVDRMLDVPQILKSRIDMPCVSGNTQPNGFHLHLYLQNVEYPSAN